VLIGRDAERRALASLAVAARVSESGALLVVGEAGQGKTALLTDLAERAEGLRVLWARGTESESDLAFGGLDQLVRPLLPLLGEIPDPQALALETALALRPGERADRFAISAATLSLLGRAAEEQPVLVLVDDAHALDRPSAEALAFVARRILADPLALVVASRPTGGVLLGAGLPRIEVEGLSPTEVAALLTQRSGHLLPEDVAVRVHEATAGNPLAIVELADAEPELLDGLTPATPIGVPDRVVAEYVRRTAGLGASARTALLVASVAATASGSSVTAAAMARLGAGWEDLREAEAAGLVVLRPGGVEFRHPLARAGAYAAASAEQRREAHLAVAAVTDDPDRRAWHRGEGTLGLDDEVADEVAAAARRSLDRGAYWVAASSYERSAALATDREQRAERLLAAGEAADLAGHGTRAGALLDLAATETGDPWHRGRIDALRGAVEQRWGSLERSRDLIRRALAELAPASPDAAVDAATDLVGTCFYLGDTALAARTADLLDRLADRASDAARIRCLLVAGVARVLAGEDGIASIRAAVGAMAGAPPEPDERRPSWLVLGPLFLREESATARGLAELAERRLRDRSAIGSLAGLLFVVARFAGTSDRWDDAARHYQEGIALAREAGQTTDLAMHLAGLAWLEARTGVEESCREHAAEALRLADRHRVHLARIWATYALGDLALGAGRHAEALERYAELQAFLERIGFRDVDISPAPELVECLHRTDRRDEAARLAEDYRRRASAKGQPWALARAERTSALVVEDPRPGLVRATELHAASPDRFEEARTRLALGEAERRARRRTASREPLRMALASFESLGARPWADRAAAELEATGERPHRRADRSIDLLTPQELQVATLLAEGRTTRQAAAAMFLSPKTVEYHLRHAYTKLGINTRTDLAAVLAGETSVGTTGPPT